MKLLAKLIIQIPVSLLILTGCVESIVMDPHDKDLPVAVCCILKIQTRRVSTVFHKLQTPRLTYKGRQ